MDKELEIREGVVLKYNEKAFADTAQVLQRNTKEGLENLIARLSVDNDPNAYASIYFPIGKKLFLEIDVTDSYMSSLLFDWIHGKSDFDKGRLEVFGCSLKSIGFERSNGYTEEQKQAIKTLYESIFGQQN